MAKADQQESRQERQTPPAPGERLPGDSSREAQFPDDDDEFEEDGDDSEEDMDEEDSDTEGPDGTNNSAA